MVVAFGGDGTVNEAANGLLRLVARRSAACPAARPTCSPRCSASPASSSTRPSTCSRWPTTGARARSISACVNGRCFTFASGLGLDASVVERVDANPRLKARLGAYYFTWVARQRRSCAATCSAPPRMRVETGGEHARRASPRSSRTARRSPTSRTARSRSPTAPRSTPARSPACVLHRATTADDALDRLARLLAARARRRATAR